MGAHGTANLQPSDQPSRLSHAQAKKHLHSIECVFQARGFGDHVVELRHNLVAVGSRS